ncbi:hypothetical protein [Enterococcus sp. AZ072]|uniref:hypothetical protein n=1 Tax=unclassified Enterococcus TaxID=2608891 RepID=UPI003D2B4C64
MQEKKTITLPIGKTVNPVFDGQNNLSFLKVSPNMTASLIDNNVVDDQSILEVKEVILLSKFRMKTIIPIQSVRIISSGTYCLYVKNGVKINRGRIVQPRGRQKRGG